MSKLIFLVLTCLLASCNSGDQRGNEAQSAEMRREVELNNRITAHLARSTWALSALDRNQLLEECRRLDVIAAGACTRLEIDHAALISAIDFCRQNDEYYKSCNTMRSAIVNLIVLNPDVLVKKIPEAGVGWLGTTNIYLQRMGTVEAATAMLKRNADYFIQIGALGFVLFVACLVVNKLQRMWSAIRRRKMESSEREIAANPPSPDRPDPGTPMAPKAINSQIDAMPIDVGRQEREALAIREQLAKQEEKENQVRLRQAQRLAVEDAWRTGLSPEEASSFERSVLRMAKKAATTGAARRLTSSDLGH